MSAILLRARETLIAEIEGIQSLVERLDVLFEKAVDLLFTCRGNVICLGMGKSGIIGQKIAATLTSTGTPAIFLHPAECYHGDLGLITKRDMVLVISNSGETEEIVKILGHIQALGIPLVAITGNANSTLALNATAHLCIAVDKEACPLGLTPTTSTTASLALGDALAMCLLEKRQFKEEDFAVFHPGGSLGKKLTITVADLMVSGDRLPFVDENTLVRETIHQLSEKQLGIVVVLDEVKELAGVFTVGDLMRLIEKQNDFLDHPISNFMTSNPKVSNPQDLAAKALHVMEVHSITCLVVVENKLPVGVLQIYDILRAGVY